MNHDQHREVGQLLYLTSDAKLWGVGFDTTGEGLHEHILPGHIRVYDSLAEQYKQGGYPVIENFSIPDGSGEKRVTLVDFRSVSRIPEGYLRYSNASGKGKHDTARGSSHISTAHAAAEL